jgi:sugar phosphate isomerase/epimerase
VKLGLSTWSLLGLDVYSACSSIGEAGGEYVELWGEVPHAYPGWVDAARLKDELSSFDMVVTAHAPFTDLNIASPFQPVKRAVEETLTGFIELSAELGARMVTVHPGTVHSPKLLPQSASSSAATLRKLVRAAGGRLTVNVENLESGDSRYRYPVVSGAKSLRALLDDVDGLKCTLDTGHAYASGEVPLKIGRAAGSRLAEVHLHDNGGTADEHLIPGEGKAPLKPVLELASSEGALVCLELDPYRYSARQALAALKRGQAPGPTRAR